MRTVGDRGQLLTFPGERLAQIARRIAHLVVGDGLTAKRGKPVAPLAVIVAIGNCFNNSAESVGSIGLFPYIAYYCNNNANN